MSGRLSPGRLAELMLDSSGRTARLVDGAGALVVTGETSFDDHDVFALIDALVAMAAAEHDCVLATRDARAKAT